MDVRRNFSRVGQRPNFSYPSQVADDAMQMDVHKTLYSFHHISLRRLNLNSRSLSKMFSTLRLSEMLVFLNYLNIHFFKPFLQISHNLRINNMSGGKTLSQNCFKCCNLSVGVALIVWFTTNGMCVKNNTIICVARASNSKKDCGVVALLILTCERLNVTTSVRKERLRAWSLLLLAASVRSFARSRSGFPIATQAMWSRNICWQDYRTTYWS